MEHSMFLYGLPVADCEPDAEKVGCTLGLKVFARRVRGFTICMDSMGRIESYKTMKVSKEALGL